MDKFTDKNFLDKTNKHNLKNELIKACKNGDLEAIKYIYGHSKSINKILELGKSCFKNLTEKLGFSRIPDINFKKGILLESACYSGNLELVKYLLTSKELRTNINLKHADHDCLYEACKMGHTEIVRYLVESEDLKYHINLSEVMDASYFHGHLLEETYLKKCFEIANENNHIGTTAYLLTKLNTLPCDKKLVIKKYFYEACEKGKQQLIELYLTHPDSKEDIDLSEADTKKTVTYHICSNNNLKTLDFLAMSKSLDKNLKISPNDEDLLLFLLKGNKYIAAKHLILNYNMEKTSKIIVQLSHHPEIEKAFNARDLSETLKQDLTINEMKKIKANKI